MSFDPEQTSSLRAELEGGDSPLARDFRRVMELNPSWRTTPRAAEMLGRLLYEHDLDEEYEDADLAEAVAGFLGAPAART